MFPNESRVQEGMFVVTEERVFKASHRVLMGDGSWEPYHEHDWILRVSVRAKKLDDKGFVVDFLDLQALFDRVLEPYVGRVFNEVPPFDKEWIPTTECIAWKLYEAMAPHIDDERVTLFRVALREAPTSWGIYEVN